VKFVLEFKYFVKVMTDLQKQQLFTLLATLFSLIVVIVCAVLLSNESSKPVEEQDESLKTGLAVTVAIFSVLTFVGGMYCAMLFF